MVAIPASATSFCPASCITVNVAVCDLRKSSMSARFSSTFTAMMTSPRGPYSFCSSTMAGNDALHGSHQEAQKSSRTTLPLRVAGSLPSRLAAARSGSGSPTLMPSAKAWGLKAVQQPAASASRTTNDLGCCVRMESSRLVPGGFSGDATFDARTKAHHFNSLFGAQNKSRRGQNAGERAVRGNDRHGERPVIDGITGPRIQDVSVTPAFVEKVPDPVARSCHRVIVYGHAGPAAAQVLGILQTNVPGAVFGRLAMHAHVLPEIHHHILDAALERHRQYAVNGVFLADAAQIEAQIGRASCRERV